VGYITERRSISSYCICISICCVSHFFKIRV